ncbi:MAG: Holliday junction branch migration DNA helicase RuvB [Candidatus Omnitrophota bacterium]|nr:Holliday junction branch migration DNA helicase RuvB [Candidatus Omnitrophota bacterium]MBU1929617.1 Holliday junction branch migration DNA helicase RuvB [Candidatus Omnitrophota bacterium]MBU2034810.1 Holliday junction branch migration DNA helicase RuvB [Candidatus Omnitrophota bacterium]MBU2221039.1 Holliday junction branch migration DNA helicase RuvB [Candidatus Omnitrophota bacterium]MBU2257887.1 Holliday junction branch migration DNA helicase RuvB [Candidatus Omnitrophota bacterium]
MKPSRKRTNSEYIYASDTPAGLGGVIPPVNFLKAKQETEEDVVLNLSLRPNKLTDFIGQKDMVANLKVCLTAAKQRKEPLEHILFSGPPGLGKTCLAHIIAHEMHSKITATSGPAIERAGDLIGILTNLEKGDILFIDEIHRLSKVVEEFIYPAMENFEIDFVIDKGPYAKTIKFHLKPFTLVGATTRTGLLTSPLRSRFGIFHHLDFYKIDDLAEIIMRSADILKVKIENDAAIAIAKRARGTPRIANRLLRRVRDFAQVEEIAKIDVAVASRTLDELGIDKSGLDNLDRKVLKLIIDTYEGGPVGIESVAASLNEEVDTLVDTIEPYLLKAGYLKRTSRGRQVTKLTYEHFGIANKDNQKELFDK